MVRNRGGHRGVVSRCRFNAKLMTWIGTQPVQADSWRFAFTRGNYEIFRLVASAPNANLVLKLLISFHLCVCQLQHNAAFKANGWIIVRAISNTSQ